MIWKTGLLFIATAVAEIVGCFLPYLWLRKNGPIWLLAPAAASLALFVWLLTLHPAASAACTRHMAASTLLLHWSGYAWSTA